MPFLLEMPEVPRRDFAVAGRDALGRTVGAGRDLIATTGHVGRDLRPQTVRVAVDDALVVIDSEEQSSIDPMLCQSTHRDTPAIVTERLSL